MKKVLMALIVISFGCKKNNPSENEQLPSIAIADLMLSEGTGGKTSFQFDVTLSKSFSKDVTVNYSTIEEVAVSGQDYTPVTNGTFTIPSGQTRGKITVEVTGDDIREGNETFIVRISNPINATLSRPTATARINNDDTKVAFSNEGYDAPTSYAGYSLLWSDEFSGTSLDQTIWTAENGNGCPNLCGWGNNELQYYTSGPNNIFFQEGKMIIEANNEAFGGSNYTSARLKTQGKKAIKFGKIDVRAKLPKGKGIWPAIWMLPENNVYGGWPRSGELDIMEMVGHEPNKIHGTLHFGPGPGSTQITRSVVKSSGDYSEAFHVYSIEWKEDQIKWLIDGVPFSTVNKSDFGNTNYPFNEAFHLLINLAVGGNWPGSPDATTTFPQWYILDYVRVYQ